MIPRLPEEAILQALNSSKLVLVSGPKRAGKELLIDKILTDKNVVADIVDCSIKSERNAIPETLKATNADLVVLNDAEHIADLQSYIDLALSGSIKPSLLLLCSFPPQLEPELIEALQQGGLYFKIYAPTFYEAASHFGLPNEEQLLEERLIFGNYPEVLNDLDGAEPKLRELITEVIETHLGVNDRINKHAKLWRTLQLLAFSIGEPVSYLEIGERAGLDNETVMRYIDLLEQADILIRLPSYATDKRYELKKSNCIYFMDNGIRNALISNFNPTFLRNDMDQLWKNYLVSERVKWTRMNNIQSEFRFWRTHTRQQMDLLEIKHDEVRAYKMDWEKRKKVKIPKYFTELYSSAVTRVLNRSTYWPFLSKKQ
ncbi:MAG: DUF4143 domain-containing protein [Crocinitomicaceae bacterium]